MNSQYLLDCREELSFVVVASVGKPHGEEDILQNSRSFNTRTLPEGQRLAVGHTSRTREMRYCAPPTPSYVRIHTQTVLLK